MRDLTLEKITPFLKDFIGKIEQIPPAYSAIKQQGKKLYELARKGQVIDIPKREVIITKIDILHWQNGDFPELDLHIFCGGGTYIRSIARDLGEKLGTGATLSALNRTLSCDMIIENSLNFEEIIEGKKTANLSLINLDLPLKNLPSIYLNEEESKKWCQGQKITINNNLNQEFYRTYNYVSKFIGISELRINEDIILLKPKVVI